MNTDYLDTKKPDKLVHRKSNFVNIPDVISMFGIEPKLFGNNGCETCET